jgi:pentatricopeptide repeat protein
MKGSDAMRRVLASGCVLLGLLGLVLAVPGRAVSADDGVIHVFNGKDLSHFYTWLKGLGKNNDPDKVFTVHDGMVRVSGKIFGGFITEKEFENYHLITEFKWGEETWAPRAKAARDSGILLHCVGEDGAVGGVWMESIECQMIEGGTGDIILVAGKNKPSVTVEAEKRGGQPYFKPGAEPLTMDRGRFNWYGRDPNWKDVKGFRGEQDVERPVGEWNTLECICDGDKLTYILNGKVVNKASRSSHTKGKILFQSEGAEVFFRKIDLTPLKK